MNRVEHLKWAKERALEYLKEKDIQQAAASFISDMNKHEGTRSPLVMALIMPEVLKGDIESMRKCINGFN